MLLRRVYSSIPPARAALSNTNGPLSSSSPLTSATSSTRTSTRGRVKPRLAGKSSRSLITASQRTVDAVNSASTSSRVNEGRGRRRPARLAASHVFTDSANDGPAHVDFFASESSIPESKSAQQTPRLSFTHPVPALNHVNDFQPIYLYPEQFKLHTTFTHPHLPLPLYLGTNIYTSPRKSSSTPIVEDLFSSPSPPDPAARLKRARPSTSAMGEHSSVVSALSHPSLLHHLGDRLPWGLPTPEMEFGGLGAVLESTAVKLSPASSEEWSATLDWFDGKNAKVQSSPADMASSLTAAEADSGVETAVADLTAVLSKLGLSSTRGRRSPATLRLRNDGLLSDEVKVDMSGEDGVRMDSVKRKRKKKISKHKYKKRRKATRALRKRLGK